MLQTCTLYSSITLYSVFYYSQAVHCKVCFIIVKRHTANCTSLYSGIMLQNVFHYTLILRNKVCFIILKQCAAKCVFLYSIIHCKVFFFILRYNAVMCVSFNPSTTLQIVFRYTQTLHCKVCLIILRYCAVKCVSFYSGITLHSVFFIPKYYASDCVTLH